MRTPLTERCTGRWATLLPLLGVDRSYLNGRHGPCPMCGGKDRWRWINRAGSGDWHCNQCTHGDGIELVKRYLKVDFKEAAKRIEAVLGETRKETKVAPPDESRLRAQAKRLWQQTVPVAGVGVTYLASRHLPMPDPLAVRFLPSHRYLRQEVFPALIAKISDASGAGINLHQTFLAADGRGKAPVEKPRLMLRGSIPLGSAIRLFPVGPTLGIAEGIESALSAHVLYGGIPVWSVINAGGIRRFAIPEGVEELVIFADADENYTGQSAAYERANRAVIHDKIACRVMVPHTLGQDFNDILCGVPHGTGRKAA